jgi:hypothetical protein
MNSDLRPMPFKTGWVSFDLGNHRPCDRTYCVYADDDLPPLPAVQHTGELQWLTPLAPDLDQRMQPYRPERSAGEGARALQRLATATQQAGLELPPAFSRLMASAPLQDRIPSCTACYFELGERLLPCPGSEEDSMVSFLVDQQAVVTWYLVLPRHAGHYVVASPIYLEEYAGDELAQAQAEFSDDVVVCARSFEEFLYRFWLENTIWFALHDGKPLTDEQRRYLDFYRSRGRQGGTG